MGANVRRAIADLAKLNTLRRGKSAQELCAQTREKNNAPTSIVIMAA